MILLPWSNTLAASTLGAEAEDPAFPVVVVPVADLFVVCRPVAAEARVLFMRRPRLLLRMPRLRGCEEMMSSAELDLLIRDSTVKRLVEMRHYWWIRAMIRRSLKG